jgi:MFS family permease
MFSSILNSEEAGSDRQSQLSSEVVSYTISAEPSNVPPLNVQEQKTAEKTSLGDTEETAFNFNPSWRFFLAFSSMSAITLMVALDATSLGNALPVRNILTNTISKLIKLFQKMAQLLNGTAIQAFWAGTSYLLASTVLQPIIGSFSHIFGRKPLVLISVMFFTVGIIIASIANDFTVILIGRSIQGIGGGGILTMVEIVVTDLVPLRIRGQYYSLISSMWAIGSVAGPILGM